METPQENFQEPANIRFLRRLVTLLTATMICGLIIIVTLIVMQFSRPPAPLPTDLVLPDGTTPVAFTRTAEWYAVISADNRILIYDNETHELRQTISVESN